MTGAALVLEDGTIYRGRSAGFAASATGEVVFNTGMVGYTEALTDPSYRGQMLALTYPLVGNYGVPEHFESPRIQAAALIVAEIADEYSHAGAARSLPQWLVKERIPCLAGIDTRALTKRLRTRGCMRGTILVEGKDLQRVADETLENRIYQGEGKRILLVDCGAKESIATKLLERGFSVARAPWNSDFLGEDFDACVVSNGPGDPTAYRAAIGKLKKVLQGTRPVLGICLGHQLLALAAGARTYKLKFGHRGHNQPCLEEGTGRCYITSQNHGYAVDAATLPAGWHAWFTNANDGSNEGMRHATRPFLSVQFHPEAAPGPVDCEPIFDSFAALVK